MASIRGGGPEAETIVGRTRSTGAAPPAAHGSTGTGSAGGAASTGAASRSFAAAASRSASIRPLCSAGGAAAAAAASAWARAASASRTSSARPAAPRSSSAIRSCIVRPCCAAASNASASAASAAARASRSAASAATNPVRAVASSSRAAASSASAAPGRRATRPAPPRRRRAPRARPRAHRRARTRRLDRAGVALGGAGRALGLERGGQGGGVAALAGAVELGLQRGARDALHAQAGLGVGGGGLGGRQPGLGHRERGLQLGDPGAQRLGARRRGLAIGGQLGLRGLERVGARLGGLEAPAQLDADLLVDGLLAAPAALELLAGRVRGGDRRGQPRVGGLARPLELRARLGDLGARLREPGLELRPDGLQRAGPLALRRELLRPRLQRAARRHVAERALRLEHREPHRVAGARGLARAQREPPLARLRAQPGQRLQRARQRGLAALGEPGELFRRRPGSGAPRAPRRRRRRARAAHGGRRRGLDARRQRVALRDHVGEPPLQLGRLQLQRLDGLQRLGGDPRLLALGRLGAARAPLGEHRAVDDLAAGLLRGRLGGRPAAARRARARAPAARSGAAGPLDPQRLGLGGHERARHEVGAAPGRGSRAKRASGSDSKRCSAPRRAAQLGQPGLGGRERAPAPAHAHEAAVGPRREPLDGLDLEALQVRDRGRLGHRRANRPRPCGGCRARKPATARKRAATLRDPYRGASRRAARSATPATTASDGAREQRLRGVGRPVLAAQDELRAVPDHHAEQLVEHARSLPSRRRIARGAPCATAASRAR